MVSKRVLEYLLTLDISTLVATLIVYLRGLYPETSLIILSLLGFLIIPLIILIYKYESLVNRYWAYSMHKRLNYLIVGIINEDRCQRQFTSFTPEDWRDRLTALHITCKLIPISGINKKFAAIINPYGEVYPEEELLTLKTFVKIKKYIADGGIFLCAGGFVFFMVGI